VTAQISHSEFAEHVERAHDAWSRALRSPELEAVARALEAAAITPADCVREVATISELATTRRRLETMRRIAARSAGGLLSGAFERFVLGHAVIRYRTEFESAAVTPVVKRLTSSGLMRFAEPRTRLDLSESRFVALCKMATTRRFAAGPFDWELAGLPRSWLPAVRPLPELFRLLAMVTFEWRGFGPAFFVHMAVSHPVVALREREVLKSYHRMARSMKLQPNVKGLIASAWLHSPATFEVSPHLAWLNKVFADNGAIVATMGPATPDCGVLVGSVERQRAFTDGHFKPTLGLVVWSRRDMLAWAVAHPELDS
jgi:hypothetical protein